MSKVVLRTLDNLQNEPTALAVINQNFTVLEDVIDTLVSRDGAVPNTMLAILDMNGHKIINLPVPTTPTEPARAGDIVPYVEAAAASAAAAAASAEDAQESEDATLVLYTNFGARYIGTSATDPTVDALGNALVEGALYWNSDTDTMYVWAVRDVYDGADQVFVDLNKVVVSSWDPLPSVTLRGLTDVNADSITDGQFLQWNAGTHVFDAFTLDGTSVPYTGSLNSTNVSDALDEIVSRVVLDAYDIQFYLEGLMSDGEHLFRLGALRSFTIPSVTTGFIAKAAVAATGTTTVLLLKNGVQFGTIVWAPAGTAGTWTIPGDTGFVAGDILTVQAPGSVDTSLADVVLGIIARR